MKIKIEKISAITLTVADVQRSVEFYRDVLGLEIVWGGSQAGFSSLRIPHTESPILNLQQGRPIPDWGRIIFHVADVDRFWTHLHTQGLHPERPENASWGERYFHVRDPDGNELSFARPLPP